MRLYVEILRAIASKKGPVTALRMHPATWNAEAKACGLQRADPQYVAGIPVVFTSRLDLGVIEVEHAEPCQ
jgi:hypothetical protein